MDTTQKGKGSGVGGQGTERICVPPLTGLASGQGVYNFKNLSSVMNDPHYHFSPYRLSIYLSK